MSSPDNTSPVNPIPPVVVALFLVVIGIEAAFSLGARGLIGGPGAVGWRSAAIQSYGFNSDIMKWMLQNGVYPGEHMIRFVSFIFVHGTFTHALFGGAMLLALGKFVGDVFSGWATLLLFLASSVAGAAIFGLVAGGQPWLIGVFPGVYGLIGGFTYLMWLKLGQMGAQQYRAFTLIGFLMGIQLFFGLVFGGNGDWLADVGGFAFGFVLSFFLAPGGWSKIRAKIRHR
ncbi:Rhomboid family protein [Roseovarius litorisediminis]|uniref:Rhomboid family protein n=1 Tax=Roseovarius litorisediminis TaxID=1312363 RepID=A0A1Y5RQA8_9RHOB|nr:rhomboid family intramembrane serine protease [Roseovarius litorisediminis]SLN22869.1 Rhomboid family protein [Roseovarius litorisediminis]